LIVGIRRASRGMMVPTISSPIDARLRPTPAEPASAAAKDAPH
jgi:hypothetical protein